MSGYAIEFETIHNYDTLKTGITLPVTLGYNSLTIDFEAKLDTGSSHCIFERRFGENLGLEIENGTLEKFGTATSGFFAFGHELTLSVLNTETYATVYFAESGYFARSVLGRQGWLDRVKLGLIDYEGKLLLSEYSE
ncbi:hypothetical protein BH20ACI1_BH20ACI1_16200 [soil metagenome]